MYPIAFTHRHRGAHTDVFVTQQRNALDRDFLVDQVRVLQINVKPLITHRFDFADVEKAFQFAATMPGDAIKIMQRALKEFRIDGVKTTVSLHKKILKDTYFRTGNIDTQFIKNRLDVYEAAPKDTKDMSKEQLASTISESMYFA